MKPIVVKAADADSIARLWGDLRHVDRLKGGEAVTLKRVDGYSTSALVARMNGKEEAK